MKSETLRGIKYSAIALAVTLGMTACSLEGDDGEDGVQGPVGEQGPVEIKARWATKVLKVIVQVR